MSADLNSFVANIKKIQEETAQKIIQAQNQSQAEIKEHNFETLAGQTQDQQTKKYYEEMHALITRLKKETNLTHQQALEHDETKKLIKQYKDQPAGLLIDSSGRSLGIARFSVSSSSTHTSSTSKTTSSKFLGFKKSSTTTSSSQSSTTLSSSIDTSIARVPRVPRVPRVQRVQRITNLNSFNIPAIPEIPEIPRMPEFPKFPSFK